MIMFKHMLACAIVLCLSACVKAPVNRSVYMSAEELNYTNSNQVTACYSRGGRPVQWLDGDQPTGIAVETLRATAARINLHLKFVPQDSQGQVFDEFKLGKCDIIVVAKPTPERDQFMDFTQPYLFVNTTMLVRQLPIKFPMRVGVGRKLAVQSFIEQYGKQVDVVEFKSDRISFNALVQNDVSAIVIDELLANQYEKETGQRFGRSSVNFYYDLSFAYQESNQLLGSLLNRGLTNLTPEEKAEIYRAEIEK